MELYQCSSSRTIQDDYSVVSSSLMFASGVLGNVVALFILFQHKLNTKNKKTSVFYMLVTGLTIVNFTGKVMVCPMVLAAYSKNQTLFQLADSQSLCQFFGFTMIFFSLAPTIILLAMTLDCWPALANPFIYREHINSKTGFMVPLVSCIFSVGFCSLPFCGIGQFVQYCPGTWCFLKMTVKDLTPYHRTFTMLYATVMGLLVLATIVFNVAIMRLLHKMHQRQNAGTKVGNKTLNVRQSGMEERDHLILLAIMTILFSVCSLPLTGLVYVRAFTEDINEYYDLLVLRLLSMNSAVDPWIFIICRTPKFYTYCNTLCSRLCGGSHIIPPVTQITANANSTQSSSHSWD